MQTSVIELLVTKKAYSLVRPTQNSLKQLSNGAKNLSTLTLLHSLHTPWFRRKIGKDTPAILAKIVPIQHLLQAFNRSPKPLIHQHLPWHTLQDMAHNANLLLFLATVIIPTDSEDYIELRAQFRVTRRAIRSAMRERIRQLLLRTKCFAHAGYAIGNYQSLCVLARTQCEANTPELIELFTERV